MIRSFGGVSGISNNGVDLGNFGSHIKSIQRGESYNTAAQKNIAINAVNPNNTLVEVSYRATDADSVFWSNLMLSVELTSSTNLLFEIGSYDSGNVPRFSYVVTEYNNVKSKQSGTYTLTGNGSNALQTATISITTVKSSKSRLVWSVHSTLATDIENRMPMKVYLTDSNIVVEVISAATYNYYIKWQVLEFN